MVYAGRVFRHEAGAGMESGLCFVSSGAEIYPLNGYFFRYKKMMRVYDSFPASYYQGRDAFEEAGFAGAFSEEADIDCMGADTI